MVSINANVSSAAELRATAAYLVALATIREASTDTPTVKNRTQVIAPEDNPAKGIETQQAVAGQVRNSDLQAAAAAARQHPNDLQAAAAVFGGAAVHVPPPPIPAAPSGAAAGTSPTAPAAAPATTPVQTNDAALTVPSPVPPAAVPTAATSNPAAVAGSVELDASGLPWDHRIHGGTRAKNADGTWRQRRGLNDPALKARVEAELRAAMAAPAPVVPPPFVSAAGAAVGLPVPPASVVPPPPVVASAVPQPTAPATGGASAAANTQGSGGIGPVSTLPELMQQVAPLMADGRLDMPKVIAACQAVGVPSLAVLGVRPDLVPGVWQHLHTSLLPQRPAA